MNKPTEFAYQALLRDLVHNEPRQGFESVKDIDLTTHQVATVIDHFPEIVAEAVGDMPAAMFGTVLADPTPESCQLYCSLMLEQVRHEAKKYILYDLQDMAERVAEERRNDDSYNRRAI